jgi:hypothetical protein
VDGYTFLDHLDWDNFNESLDLKPQIKAYQKRFGRYPESVHADKIYRTRSNIKYCKSKNIRLSGPPLGRPPKEKELQKQIRKQTRQDELDRIPIEGKFGQGKRRFSLSKIMCKLADTSASAIAIAFLVLNLEKWLSAGLGEGGQPTAADRKIAGQICCEPWCRIPFDVLNQKRHGVDILTIVTRIEIFSGSITQQ